MAPGGQVAPGAEAGDPFTDGSQQADAVAQVQQRSEGGGYRRIARQVGDQAVAQGVAEPGRPRGQHLDLHARHVHAGGAFALAGLARDTQGHGVGHGVRAEGVRSQLSRQGQAQAVGPAARDMLLVAGGAVGGAHGPARAFAAGAIVIALLDSALQTADCARIVGPVQHRLEVFHRIVGGIAEQVALIEIGRAHDLAGIEIAGGIEQVFHLLEGALQARAEHGLVELAAHDAVAVLARVRALELAHHGEGFLGDGAHGGHVLVQAQIEHRAHVQAAFGGMGVPGAARAVAGETGGQALGIFGQVLQRHGAVLDKGDRLGLVLHRHHDVQARGAQIGDGGLQAQLIDIDHPAPF